MGGISGTDSQSVRRFTSVADPATDAHLNGDYLRKNSTWHVEYSPWKAQNVHRMIRKHNLRPQSICEVGCGAGEVLRQLQLRMDPHCVFSGFDVAPPAIEMAKTRTNDRLHFELADFGELDTPPYDLLLALEVVDHVEDYIGFVRMLKHKAEHKIFSFSLDISVQSAFRSGAFTQRRVDHSHLHHFNKEVALGTLQHAGYEILDYCYPPNLAFSTRAKLAKPIRRTIFNLSPELTVRLFGGYSLLVLTR
jgi:2-polyprenyl-3-methyl-5-hydroxy-6-metoxy-1,4-benzoquinol methylase